MEWRRLMQSTDAGSTWASLHDFWAARIGARIVQQLAVVGRSRPDRRRRHAHGDARPRARSTASRSSPCSAGESLCLWRRRSLEIIAAQTCTLVRWHHLH